MGKGKHTVSKNVLISSGKFEKEKRYWLRKLSGELTVGTVGTFLYNENHNKIDQWSENRKQKKIFPFPGQLYKEILRIGNQSQYGVFIIITAGLSFLLSWYSGKGDIIIGTPIFMQYQSLSHFNQMLPLRNRVWGETTFKDFLFQLKQTISEAVENMNYPLDKIVKELDLSYHIHQLYDAVMVFRGIHGDVEDVIKEQKGNIVFSFDMTQEYLECELSYPSSFNHEHSIIDQFWRHFINFFRVVSKSPMIRLGNIDVLSDDEKKKILSDFNHTGKEYPEECSLHQLFEGQVNKTPAKVALEYEGNYLTYDELNRRVDRLAGFLRKKGISTGSLCGIMMGRSIEQIIAIFAALKLEFVFLMLDPKLPGNRLEFVINDTRLPVILTIARTPVFELNYDGLVVNLNIDAGPDTDVDIQTGPSSGDKPVYVIYTSGSTGRPKGVVGLHQGVLNRCHWMWRTFPFQGNAVCCQKTSMNFVDSIWEIFGPLLKGVPSVIIPDETVIDLPRLVRILSTRQVTRIVLVPGLLYRFFDSDAEYYKQLSHLKFWVSSGEALNPDFLPLFQKSMPGCVLLNLYGSSEVSADVTYYDTTTRANNNLRPVPIGHPLDNTQIYILDNHMRPVPFGVLGEIYVGGAGLAAGYLNQPELTAEKFCLRRSGGLFSRKPPREASGTPRKSFLLSPSTGHSPYSSYLTIYRTGDLGQYLADGTIQLLGRQDHQVKVRGFRIELGEIEYQLGQLPAVKEVVVVARQDEQSDKYLCAYIVLNSKEKTDVPELRRLLTDKLPDYMIPTYFILLDKLPLTPGGKPDRTALPDPAADKQEGEYTAPRDKVEKTLVHIWWEILKKDKETIAIDSNFFQLGGHSLKAISIISRIHKILNVKIPVAEIFKRPTIRELSGYLRGLGNHWHMDYTAIEMVEKQEYYPLSSAQRRLYVLQQMAPESTVYNMSQVLILEGEPRETRLESAVRKLLVRHESLRTSFFMMQEKLVLQVKNEDEIDFNIVFSKAESNEEIGTVVDGFIVPFELENAPLLRVRVIKLEQARYILAVDMHHIISDGVSLNILIEDFIALYGAEKLPCLKIRYVDYSVWQNSAKNKEMLLRQKRYWKNLFQGEMPVLDLPVDRARSAVQSYEGRRVEFSITREETGALSRLALEEEATLFMVLLALYHIFLSKLSGQENIVIGSPVAGRDHADLEPVIGVFLNTLALRNSLFKNQTFKAFLSRLKENTLMAFENREYQYEDLVEEVVVTRDVSRNPLFDVMFIWQNMELAPLEIPGLKLTPYQYEGRTSMFDLTLETMEKDNQLFFSFQYCTQLFKSETIERFIRYFKILTASVINNPEGKIQEIEIQPEEERKRILQDFNCTRTDYPQDKTIRQLFEAQVQRTPTFPAVVCEGRRLSYERLNEKANGLARVLRKRGMKPGKTAVVAVDRSLELAIAVLAVLKTGGAYLPVDPDYPQKRLEYIIKDTGTEILLTDIEEILLVSKTSTPIDLRNPGGDEEAVSHLPAVGTPADPAYIVYTSGTTGKPKGVVVPNQCVVNFINGLGRIIEFTASDAILSLTTISFDIFGLETLLPLTRGTKVVIGSKEEQLNSEAAARVFNRENITIFQVTPSRLQLFISGPGSDSPVYQCLESLKYLLVGGEAFPSSLHAAVKRLVRGKIYNLYGPAETTIWSTVKDVTGENALNIGKPIANTQIYILNKDGVLQPIGVTGELCIAGDGVARGYVNRPELTAEKFDRDLWDYQDYHDEERKVRAQRIHPGYNRSSRSCKSYVLYKTGDLARWLWDGNIEFLGRVDHQVKIRGFRIEPEEIESLLKKHQMIEEAVVVMKNMAENSYLCAYILPGPGNDRNNEAASITSGLRDYLSAYLPDYMVPSYFTEINEIPLTPNGKIDREALPEPGIFERKNEYIAPGNEMEEKVVRLCSEVLRVDKDKIGVHDNFFHLGANSLTIIQLNSRLKRAFKIDIPAVAMFRYLTVHAFAQFLSRESASTMAEILTEDMQRSGRLEEGKLRLKQKMKRRRGIQI